MAIQTFLTPKFYDPQLIQSGVISLTKAAAASSATATVNLASGKNIFATVSVNISGSFYPLEHVIYNVSTGVVDADLYFSIDDNVLSITYDTIASSLTAAEKTYEFSYNVYSLKLVE